MKQQILITGLFNSYTSAAKALGLKSHHDITKAIKNKQSIRNLTISSHKINKAFLFSPSMHEKSVADFYNKPTTYILYFTYKGKTAIKFGSTKDFKKRFQEHKRTYKNPKIWAIFTCRSMDHAMETEKMFKNRMKTYLHPIKMGKKVCTEILYNISPEHAETSMHNIINNHDTKSIIKAIELVKCEIHRLELAMQQFDPKV